MKSNLLILIAAGLAFCARKDAPANSSILADDKSNDVYARKADVIFAKHGESVPQETSSPILIERALGEMSARIPAAKDRQARITFQGDRLAVVVISYALPGSDARLDQSIQFFRWERKWELTWIQSPQQKKG
jgi:hypothetical protein